MHPTISLAPPRGPHREDSGEGYGRNSKARIRGEERTGALFGKRTTAIIRIEVPSMRRAARRRRRRSRRDRTK